MNFAAGLGAALALTMAFVPKFIGFVVVMLVGWFVAKIVGDAVTKAAARIGTDRWLERGGMRAALERSGYSVSRILGKITYYTICLFVLQLAFGIFAPNPISALLTQLIAFLPNIFVAVLIAVIAASVAAAVKDIIQEALGGLSYGRTLANVAAISILVIGVFAALNQLAIAPAIINGLFYAMLAIIVGSAVIAIGGGGIVPMRAQWERALNRLEAEAPRLQAQIQRQAPQVPPLSESMDIEPEAYRSETQHVQRDTEAIRFEGERPQREQELSQRIVS